MSTTHLFDAKFTADAKYCAFDIQGELKYYVCPRTEYCCNFGCCVSPGFQIYHLWYYWLLVIIMFLVCSGGGWWYRYWLQGRYRAAASAIPSRSSISRTQNPLRGPTCNAQQARISYNTARNTVLLHRMWKGPHRSTSSPAHNGAAASSTQYQNTSVVLNDNNCPYYQLYGPPPSYETVIAQTRGKISCPASPDNSRLQSSIIQNQSIPHCFAHSYSPSRINGVLEAPELRGSEANPANQHIETFEATYPHFPQQFNPIESTRIQDTCMIRSPMNLRRLSVCSGSGNTLKADTSSPEKYSIQRIDCASGSREHSHCEICAEESIFKLQQQSKSDLECRIHQKSKVPLSSITVIMPSDMDENPGKSQRSEIPRIQGGSLKLFRDSDKKNVYPRLYEISRKKPSSRDRGSMESNLDSVATPDDSNFEPAANLSGTTRLMQPSGHDVPPGTSSFQSNPSNNVILDSVTSNIVDDSPLSDNVNENYRHSLLTTRQGSTNLNLESKCKIDRSRSLD